MALPSSGLITAAMISQELGRAPTAPFNINDPLIREIAGKPSGSIKFSDLHGKSYEIVKRITTSGAGPDLIKSLFTASEWASKRPKRVIINSGVEIGGNGHGYALAVTDNASGQAGSFAGRLILENHGFISGRGGAANGGAGKDALLANFLGRDGNKLEIYNYGTIRGGGGGGGRGGTGGTGGGGSYDTFTKEPATGYRYHSTTDHYYTRGTTRRWVWNGTTVSTSSGSPTAGGWKYYAGNERSYGYDRETNDGNLIGQWWKYEIRREGNVTTNTNGGTGGAGGNGGRGQGYGQARANGAGGAAGAAGGTNAGRGGTGGTGGNGGDWGAAGAAGNSGATGAAGNRTSGAAGAGGAAGGAAGCYINGNARVTWHVNGTRQGRAV